MKSKIIKTFIKEPKKKFKNKNKNDEIRKKL
jgi:hypothetical protein